MSNTEYYVALGTQKKGPFSLSELSNQDIAEDTLIWKKGLTNWTAASNLPELEDLLDNTPPPIPEQPPPIPTATNVKAVPVTLTMNVPKISPEVTPILNQTEKKLEITVDQMYKNLVLAVVLRFGVGLMLCMGNVDSSESKDLILGIFIENLIWWLLMFLIVKNNNITSKQNAIVCGVMAAFLAYFVGMIFLGGSFSIVIIFAMILGAIAGYVVPSKTVSNFLNSRKI
jgi:hypothetical protein